MDESRIKMVNVFDRHSTLGFKVSNSKYQVKLNILNIYRQSPVKTPDINKHYSSNVNV